MNSKFDTQYKLTSSNSEHVKILKYDVKEVKKVQVQRAATLDQLKAGMEAGVASHMKARKVSSVLLIFTKVKHVFGDS